MSCLHPMPAWIDRSVTPNQVHFKVPPEWYALGGIPPDWVPVRIPCGKCYLCLKTRALDITVRAVAESRMHDFATFITLTCDDRHMQSVFPNNCLEIRPWQLFAKRLRKRGVKFKYLMCGEYGSLTVRPHYHAVLFGPRFLDHEINDDCTYTPSRLLADCWPFGQVQCSDVNPNRIAYCAGYTLKDYQLGRDSHWYESRNLRPPFVRWSRRPALGLVWFRRYWRDLLRGEGLTFRIDGKPFNFSGRYFVDKLQLISPADYDRLIASREDALSDDEILDLADKNNRAAMCGIYKLKERRIQV